MKNILFIGLAFLSFQIQAQVDPAAKVKVPEAVSADPKDGEISFAGCSISADQQWIECPFGRFKRHSATVESFLDKHTFEFDENGNTIAKPKKSRKSRRAKKD